MVRARVSRLIGSTSVSCTGAVMQPARVEAVVALSSQAGPMGGRLPGQPRTIIAVNLLCKPLSRALVAGSVTPWHVPPPGQSASVRHGACGVEPPLHCARQIAFWQGFTSARAGRGPATASATSATTARRRDMRLLLRLGGRTPGDGL